MGRYLYIVLLLVSPLWSQAADQAELTFAQGNGFYAKAKYKEAAQSYERLLDSGYVSSELYFNLGNAYYKLDEIPLAVLNYEKAFKLAPGDEDIRVNIQFANSKIADKIEAVPEFFLAKWWRSLILYGSLESLSVLAVAGMVIGFALLTVYLFAVSPGVKKPAFYTGIVGVALALLFIAVAALQYNYLNSGTNAIVFAGTVNVKSGPKDGFKNLFVIHEGIKVAVRERADGWVKVELPNGNVGWIPAEDIREI